MTELKSAKSFEDLLVWQKAHQLVLAIYKVTQDFPKAELYGLTSQIRRAAVSVPANIAEGFKRKSNPEKLRFYNIAQASLEEAKYFIILSNDLNYLNRNNYKEQLDEIGKLLFGLIKSIENKSLTP